MSSFTLWRCKRIDRKIERFKKKKEYFLDFVIKLNRWMKADTKLLNKLMQDLTDTEYIQYAFDCGYLEKDDYDVVQILKNRKK